MKFIKTCNWCPEQYDIFDEEKQVAYMRVKYGICECYVPDADGTIVYLSYIKGRGEFIDDEERQLHFKNATKCIQNYYDKKKKGMRNNELLVISDRLCNIRNMSWNWNVSVD